MAENNPLLIILAGPNGAGKSTFYKKFIEDDPFLQKIKRIAFDDLKVKNPDFDDLAIGKKMLGDIAESLADKTSFVYETTGSDTSARRIMQKAREGGYNTALLFIGIDSPELSQARVKQRVNSGGHDVPAESIFTRYEHILKNLHKMVNLSDFSAVFENSGKEPFKPLLIVTHDMTHRLSEFPEWLKKAFSYAVETEMQKEKQPIDFMLEKFKKILR